MKKQGLKVSFMLLTACFLACNNEAQVQTSLTVTAFEKAIFAQGAQILDVRTMDEYQSGHIKNAFLADWTNPDEFLFRIQSLDKSKPVYAYCFSGARSSKAASLLREKGFIVYNLTGGIAGWKREEKPLEAAISVKQLSVSDYQSMIPADKTVLVDIGAIWCPPCKKMEPLIDSLASLEQSQFTVVKIDGGAQNTIVQSLSIKSFPTFIIYKKGKEVWRKEGPMGIELLAQQLK